MTTPSTPPYVLISHTDALSAALAELEGAVAVDTEFHSERHYAPRLKLIQLRGERGPALIIDPKSVHDLSAVGAALSGRRLLIHAHSQDVQLLSRLTGLKPGEVVDPQILAGFSGWGFPRSLNELVEGVLGESLPHGASLSNWTQRPLSDRQLRYAAADVNKLHALTEALEAKLAGSPARRWARAATEELVADALRPVDADALWRRVPGAAVLDDVGRETLRALMVWREGLARSMDQPRWQVASDAALLDVARRRPSNADELAENRKMPKRLLREFAPMVLSAARDAEQVPPDERPPPVAIRDRAAMLDALLAAWAFQQECERGVAAQLLMPRELRQDLTLSWLHARWPAPPLGWREQGFGEEISQLMAGDLALRAPKKS